MEKPNASVQGDGPLDWDGLVSKFAKQLAAGWLFRGQRESSWALKTSLERHTPKTLPRQLAESRLVIEFKRRAHAYITSNDLPEDHGEWLALMQHFGAPTRLLDVTRSPYVATYFAVEDQTDGDSAVWAINEEWCRQMAGAAMLATTTEDHIRELRTRLKGDFDDLMVEKTLRWVFGTKAAIIEGDRSLEQRLAVVVPYEPHKLTERLSVQQGAFLMPRDVEKSFMDNLTAVGKLSDGVVKLTIAARERPRILDELRKMNITRASLFPGLEGYAQSFRQMLFEESPEERRARLARQLGHIELPPLELPVWDAGPIVPEKEEEK